MAELFDCSPRMAVKLARCEQIAMRQTYKTLSGYLAPMTHEDYCILQHRAYDGIGATGGSGALYMENLNV